MGSYKYCHLSNVVKNSNNQIKERKWDLFRGVYWFPYDAVFKRVDVSNPLHSGLGYVFSVLSFLSKDKIETLKRRV